MNIDHLNNNENICNISDCLKHKFSVLFDKIINILP